MRWSGYAGERRRDSSTSNATCISNGLVSKLNFANVRFFISTAKRSRIVIHLRGNQRG